MKTISKLYEFYCILGSPKATLCRLAQKSYKKQHVPITAQIYALQFWREPKTMKMKNIKRLLHKIKIHSGKAKAERVHNNYL